MLIDVKAERNIMTIDQVIAAFGNASRAAEWIGFDRATISNWKRRGEIPLETQIQIEFYWGKIGLKADLSVPPATKRTILPPEFDSLAEERRIMRDCRARLKLFNDMHGIEV